MSDLVQQIRLAGRSLVRTPVVTAAAVVSLALGLGATTAVFSAVSAALLDGMPFSEPESLVSVFRTTPHFRNGPFAPANFLDLREQTETLETLGAVGYGTALLKRSERTYQVTARDLSPDLFATLGEDESGEVPMRRRAADLARSAMAVVCAGTCSSFGGIPSGDPNPTGACSISDLLEQEGIATPVVNTQSAVSPANAPRPIWGSLRCGRHRSAVRRHWKG